jgi:hypothetical protein
MLNDVGQRETSSVGSGNVVRIHIAYQHTSLPCQFTAMLEFKYMETLTPKDSNPNLQLQGRHKGLGAPHTLSHSYDILHFAH